MAFSHSPNIVTDGLVLSLDAGDKISFSSGSTTWTDLSRNSNNGTLSVGTMGTVSGSNTIAFNGSSDEVSIANNSTLNFGSSGDFTLECIVKLDTADDNEMILGKQNGHFGQGYALRIEESGTSNNWGLQVHIEQADGTQYRTITSQTIGQDYQHCIVVCDRSATGVRIHRNGDGGTSMGTLNDNLNSIGDIDVSQEFTIGADSGGARNIDGEIPIVRVYNKALSDKEALQNYNAVKNRFGI
tara:strand:+ start:1941 stop:2666 length:726 start_codon:yes stop_codon:yes gene_type:complete